MAEQPIPFRGRIYDDITQTIGHTPLIRMRRAQGADCKATIAAKLEKVIAGSSGRDERDGISAQYE